MKNHAEEYFYMVPFGASYPLLDFVDSMTDSFMLYEEHALDESHIVKFRFGEPIPSKPKLGDAHCNAQHLVVSNKIKDVMQAIQLKDVQYLPASIHDIKNNEVYENYWVLHIFNLINCLDREKSKFRADNRGRIKWINALVLDSEALCQIPLAERLVFALGEERLQMFFHASVVEKIIELQPEGVKFAPATQWDSKSLFEAAYWEYILGD